MNPRPTSTLAIPVRGPRQQPPVSFSHRVHEPRRVACQRGHHEYQGRRNLWKQGQPVKKAWLAMDSAPRRGARM